VNQRVAAACDTVVLMVAGIPLTIKTPRRLMTRLASCLARSRRPAGRSRGGRASSGQPHQAARSLGRLEEIALRLALLRGGAPEVDHPVIFTFAADHGVTAEGVSAYPRW